MHHCGPVKTWMKPWGFVWIFVSNLIFLNCTWAMAESDEIHLKLSSCSLAPDSSLLAFNHSITLTLPQTFPPYSYSPALPLFSFSSPLAPYLAYISAKSNHFWRHSMQCNECHASHPQVGASYLNSPPILAMRLQQKRCEHIPRKLALLVPTWLITWSATSSLRGRDLYWVQAHQHQPARTPTSPPRNTHHPQTPCFSRPQSIDQDTTPRPTPCNCKWLSVSINCLFFPTGMKIKLT